MLCTHFGAQNEPYTLKFLYSYSGAKFYGKEEHDESNVISDMVWQNIILRVGNFHFCVNSTVNGYLG